MQDNKKFKLVSVLLSGPFDKVFSYKINISSYKVGKIIIAPFRNQKLLGIILNEDPDLIDEDLDYQSENSMEVDDQNDQKVSGDLPDPEDWENDDVPLFKSDRLDNSDEENSYDSQMEIPAFLRKK